MGDTKAYDVRILPENAFTGALSLKEEKGAWTGELFFRGAVGSDDYEDRSFTAKGGFAFWRDFFFRHAQKGRVFLSPMRRGKARPSFVSCAGRRIFIGSRNVRMIARFVRPNRFKHSFDMTNIFAAVLTMLKTSGSLAFLFNPYAYIRK